MPAVMLQDGHTCPFMDTEVLIVGAGPVGLTLAIALGQRGIRCTLIEKKAAPEFLPKMERCNARTMEIFRRMGLAEKIRAAGLDGDVPMDVYIALALNEPPLLRLKYPSVAEARTEIAGVPRRLDAARAVPAHFPVHARAAAESRMRSDSGDHRAIRLRVRLARRRIPTLSQRSCRRTVHAIRSGRSTSSAATAARAWCAGSSGFRFGAKGTCCGCIRRSITAPACTTGSRSATVRDGAATITSPTLSRRFSSCRTRRSTGRCTPTSRRRNRWRAQFERAIGVPIEYEMLYVGAWKLNLLLADRYGRGRVFLAGDAAHLVIPTGGLGMNTGVGDAVDLAWKLAGTLRGWGGPNLLASYEIERRQVGDRNIGASRYAWLGRRKWRSQYRPGHPGPNRRRAGDPRQPCARGRHRAAEEQRDDRSGTGLPLRRLADHLGGARRAGASLPRIRPDDLAGSAPSARVGGEQTPSRTSSATATRCCVSAGPPPTRLRSRRPCARVGAPFETLTVDAAAARDVYGYDLLLLRPDLHIAWRGNADPEGSGAAGRARDRALTRSQPSFPGARVR